MATIYGVYPFTRAAVDESDKGSGVGSEASFYRVLAVELSE